VANTQTDSLRYRIVWWLLSLNPNIPFEYCLLGSSRGLAGLPSWWTRRGRALDFLKAWNPGGCVAVGDR